MIFLESQILIRREIHRNRDWVLLPEYPGELSDGTNPPLRRGNVVDDGDGDHGVEAFIPVRQAQVVTH